MKLQSTKAPPRSRSPGKRQLETILLLWQTNAQQRVWEGNNRPPPWAKNGWVRLSREWVSLRAMQRRGLVQVRYYEGNHDGTAGWQARVMIKGRKVLEGAGLLPVAAKAEAAE